MRKYMPSGIKMKNSSVNELPPEPDAAIGTAFDLPKDVTDAQVDAADRLNVLSGPRASLIGHARNTEPGIDHGPVTACCQAVSGPVLNRSGAEGAPPAKLPFGGVRPRCRHAPAVATRPRGVRARSPARTRNGS